MGRDWEDWEEIGKIWKSGERLRGVGLGFRSCFHYFPISPHSSRSPRFRIRTQTQLGKGRWAQWEELEEWGGWEEWGGIGM